MRINTAVKILFSAAIIAAILFYVDFDGFMSAVEKLPTGVIIWALLLNIFGSVIANTLQIYFHVKDGFKVNGFGLGFARLLAIDFVVRFYALFMPSGFAAGIRWHKQSVIGIGAINSAAAIILNKALQILLISASTALAFYYYNGHIVSGALARNISAAALFIFLVFCGALIIFFRDGCRRQVKWISGYILSLKLINDRPEVARKFSTAIDSYCASSERMNINDILSIFFWSLVSYVVVSYSQYLVMVAAQIDASFYDALFLRGVVLVAIMLPFSFAGIGLRELGTVGALSLYGVDAEIGLLVGAVLFGYQLVISLIGGGIEFSNLMRSILGEKK